MKTHREYNNVQAYTAYQTTHWRLFLVLALFLFRMRLPFFGGECLRVGNVRTRTHIAVVYSFSIVRKPVYRVHTTHHPTKTGGRIYIYVPAAVAAATALTTATTTIWNQCTSTVQCINTRFNFGHIFLDCLGTMHTPSYTVSQNRSRTIP